MKKTILKIFVVSAIMLPSCNNFSDIEHGAKPYFDKFKMSECKANCKDPAQIFKQVYEDNTLKMTFGIWLNCADKKADIRTNSDTLFLEFHSNDSISYACFCYFNVDFTISNLKAEPKTILFNNRKFNENNVNFR